MQSFLEQLFLGERIVVPRAEPKATAWDRDFLREIGGRAALELSASAPPFSLEAAVWGAELLARIARAQVYGGRDASLNQDLIPPRPEPSPEASWSVDLCLRFLPGLAVLVARSSPAAALESQIADIARDWPLSSIGIPGLGEVKAGAIVLSQAALRGLYLDRVLAARAYDRLEPELHEFAAAALGAFPELDPELARILALVPA